MRENERVHVGSWGKADESVHWLLRIREPGKYRVRGEFAAVRPSALRLRVGGRRLRFQVPATGGWGQPTQVTAGRLTFDEPVVYHVVLEPADPKIWRAVNVWQFQVAPVP